MGVPRNTATLNSAAKEYLLFFSVVYPIQRRRRKTIAKGFKGKEFRKGINLKKDSVEAEVLVLHYESIRVSLGIAVSRRNDTAMRINRKLVNSSTRQPERGCFATHSSCCCGQRAAAEIKLLGN